MVDLPKTRALVTRPDTHEEEYDRLRIRLSYLKSVQFPDNDNPELAEIGLMATFQSFRALLPNTEWGVIFEGTENRDDMNCCPSVTFRMMLPGAQAAGRIYENAADMVQRVHRYISMQYIARFYDSTVYSVETRFTDTDMSSYMAAPYNRWEKIVQTGPTVILDMKVAYRNETVEFDVFSEISAVQWCAAILDAFVIADDAIEAENVERENDIRGIGQRP